MMGEKEFINIVEGGEGIIYAIVVMPKVEKLENNLDIPVEVQELLNQLKHIINNDQPAT